MKLHELKPAKGAHKERKRVGRGIAAGQGKTSGRGQKGQGSRSSVNLPRGFEGGQMPMSMRLPKLRGFHNRFKTEYAVVNLGKLNRYEAGSTVDEESLLATGLVGKALDGVKVLSSGGISVALNLHVTAISARARQLVEKAGGTVTIVERAEDVEGPITDTVTHTAPAITVVEAVTPDAPEQEAATEEAAEPDEEPGEPGDEPVPEVVDAAAETDDGDADDDDA
jgi:large subunit ribosomal protein L15